MINQTESLRIAYLTPEYVTEPKFDGGLANYLARITPFLHEHGHHPEVFVLSNRNESLEHNGVIVHRVKGVVATSAQVIHRIIKRAVKLRFDSTVQMRSGARCLATRLLQRHREHPFDIVQGSDYGATGLYIPRGRDFPFVTRLSYFRPFMRECAGVASTVDHRIAEHLERSSVQRSDICYGPSRRIAEVVRQRWNMPVEIIRPPVQILNGDRPEDESVFREQIGGKNYVLFFGRVCRVKGADLLASIMRPLLEEDESLHLVLVGREQPEGIVEKNRAELGPYANRLIHIGRLPHPQLSPVIRHAKAVLLPSRIDNFPNVCIEAMQVGQVVIGTREASFDELILDGENGFLGSIEAISSLTAAVRLALNLSPAQQCQFGDAARRTLQEFVPEVTIPALCDFYRTVIARRRN
ncbi:MAG: glycosyltransferase family 4 protein [Planctomycetaceae bacterium]|nr:glycosyltransferase family 4 protein [Planctomycetaceae bacterium]